MNTLEKEVLRVAQESVSASIKEALAKYDSPLVKLVKQVVDENSIELKGLISSSFQAVIRTEEFKQSILSAFSHKVARTIISNNDGLFDKVSNDLKQDRVSVRSTLLLVKSEINSILEGEPAF